MCIYLRTCFVETCQADED